MVNIDTSKMLYEKSKTLAPGGVHSPVRAFLAVGGTPLFIKSGKGSHIWDEDGNKYVDYCMCWGALALGHCDPDVQRSLSEQISLGTHYGTPTRWDVELSELILEAIHPYEKIRFVNSGTEAVMSALRLARGVTGKNLIVKINGSYHGHVDSMLVSAGSGIITQGQSGSKGVSDKSVAETLLIPFNDENALKETFEKFADDIAAIILEPIMANNGLFEFGQNYMNLVRDLTIRHNSLLIFDEVITGFRIGWQGAKGYYSIEPDLATYGKIIGGGLPVGAFTGKSKIMDQLAPIGPIYQAGTLSGNPLAMRAGLSTLQKIKSTNYYEKIEELGTFLDSKANSLKDTHYYKRVGGIFWFAPGLKETPTSPNSINDTVVQKYKENYWKYLESGVYLSPSVYEVAFLTSAHSKSDIDNLINSLKGS